MLGLSHAPLILASALALALSIPSAALLQRFFIFPLPFRFTSALIFSLASATDLIISIPLASTLALDLMEVWAICDIYFALASALTFVISKASVLAFFFWWKLSSSQHLPLSRLHPSPPLLFSVMSSLALAHNFNEALSISIPSASEMALDSTTAL